MLIEPQGAESLDNRKVLVIGLDGLTFDLIDPLMERGWLPHISRMRDRGYSAVLRSTVPPVSAPAWTSLITGVNPGKHGVLRH